MKGSAKKKSNAQPRSVRSINLLLDAADPAARLEHFHLTRKGAAIVHRILTAASPGRKPDRVMTIAAPPGSGKSFLALFAGALLSRDSRSRHAVDDVLSRASERARFVRAEIESFQKTKTRVLPVYIVGDASWGLHAAIYSALEEAVLRELGKEGEKCITRVRARLSKAGIAGKKKAGMAFADNRRFFEALEIVLEELEAHNFTGVAIFHDEFNRFLSRESRSFSAQLDFLQDLAEYVARKTKPVFLILLTHKSISQYADHVSPAAVRDWMKIEGRFHPVLYQEESADIYTVLAHRASLLPRGKVDDAERVSAIKNSAKLLPALADEFDGRFDLLAKKAFPLHPAAFLSLPLISNLLGQNERTAFGLIDDLLPRRSAGVVGLPDLFDYFDSSVDRLAESVGAVLPWLRARKAIAASSDAVSRDMLKALAILTLIDSPILPATPPVLGWALGLSRKESEKLLGSFLDKGLAVIRESTGRYEVHYGSAVNVRRAVEEIVPGIMARDCEAVLHEAVRLRPVHAVEFNAKNYTARFFSRRVILTQILEEMGLGREDELFPAGLVHLKTMIEAEASAGASGVVFFLLGDPARSHRMAAILQRDPFLRDNALFIVSDRPSVEMETLRRYAAVRSLLNDKKFLERDPRSREDLELLAGDLHDAIDEELRSSFSAENGKLVDSRIGKKGTQESSGRLDQIVSARLFKRYHLSPKINCELINRDLISPNIRNARKKVIRGILDRYGGELLGFAGQGPEVTIFRCLFIATRAYEEGPLQEWKFDFTGAVDCSGGDNKGLVAVVAKIHELLSPASADLSLQSIYDVVTAAPFGVCRELVPLFLVAALAEKEYSYSLYEEGRFIPTVNSDVIEKVHMAPDRFRIRVLDESEDQNAFLDAYEGQFKPKDYDVSGDNRLVRALLYILQWFARLPESTRNTRNLSEKSKTFLDAVGKSSSPEALLFETLPTALEARDARKFHEALRHSKAEIDSVYQALVDRIEKTIVRHLMRYLGTGKNEELLGCAARFLEENTERISVVVHHDLEFRRFVERLRMPYATNELMAESVAALLYGCTPALLEG